MHLFSSSETEFETELQQLLKGHQKELMASIKQRLTGVTGDIVDRVLALCMEIDEVDDLVHPSACGDRSDKGSGNVGEDGVGL